MKRFPRRRLFASAICDEISLLDEAYRLIDNDHQLLNESELISIKDNLGIDMATACLYQSLMRSAHGDFKKEIDNLPIARISIPDIKIMVIPGMFHNTHPETGADGRMVLDLAKSNGIAVQLIETNPKGSVSENSNVISQAIQNETEHTLWLISFSKGGSEVRHYLQSTSVPDKVHGWVNVAGIYSGTPCIDTMLSSWIRRSYLKVVCRWLGVGYASLVDLKSTHLFWRRTIWPKHIDIIHLVPIPLKSHLQHHLIKRHTILEKYGPNDGCVPLAQVLPMPGKIYPIWGADHFMRTSALPKLMYQLLHYIARKYTQPKEKHHETV